MRTLKMLNGQIVTHVPTLMERIRYKLNRFATTDAYGWYGRDLAMYYGARAI